MAGRYGLLAILVGTFFITSGFLIFSLVQAQTPLAAPQDFQATAVSACGIKLEWKQGETISRFEWKVKIGPGPFPAQWGTIELSDPRLVQSGSQWTLSLSELTPDKNYRFQLQACPSSGPCSSAVETSVNTPRIPDAPAPPSGLETVEWKKSNGNVVLKWILSATSDMNAATSGMRIFRADGGGGGDIVDTFTFKDFTEHARRWEDPSATSLQSHIYKIQTYQTDAYCSSVGNTTGVENWVNFSGFSGELVVPPQPTGLGESATEYNRTQAKFRWDDVGTTETGYEFDFSTQQDFSADVQSFLYGADITETGFFGNLAPSTTFYYRVRACNIAAGNSGCSDYASKTFVSGFEPPRDARAMITSVNTAANKVTIRLAWDDAATYAKRVRIYQRVSGAADFGTPSVLPQSCVAGYCTDPTSFKEEINRGNSYEYQVRFQPQEAGSSEVFAIPEQSVFINTDVLPIRGLGWSSAIGWVSIGGETVGPGNKKHIEYPRPGQSAKLFGVFYDSSNLVGGQAWVENYGWISFYSDDLAGCPDGSLDLCKAKIVEEGGTSYLRGWGRFRSVLDNTPSSWHGWVSFGDKKLDGTTRVAWGPDRGATPAWNVSTLGQKIRDVLEKPTAGLASLLRAFKTWVVSAQTIDGRKEVVEYKPSQGTLAGQAWGGELVGWIGFGCDEKDEPVKYGISCNQPPVVSGITVEPLGGNNTWCAEIPTYHIAWEYSDPDGDAQQSATIKFKKASDNTIAVTKTITTPNQRYYNFEDPLGYNAAEDYGEGGFLAPGTQYRAEVTVQDSAGNLSVAVSSVPFTTKPYYYPLVNFTHTPETVTPFAPVAFTDATSDRSTQSLALSRQWTFNGTPSTSQASPVSVIFGSLTPNAKLTVTDMNGKQCILEETLSGAGGAPGTKRRIFIER